MNANRWYDRTATAAKFLLGGIGTGNVSLGSRGQLCDWEILNRPNKGYTPPYTFCALRTCDSGGIVHGRVLEADFVPPYESSHGIYSWQMGGIPRLKQSRLSGKISSARVEFFDDNLPVEISLEAFSPFIPLNAENSGIPAFSLCYTVKNKTASAITTSISFNLCNLVGYEGKELFGSNITAGNPRNFRRTEDNLKGIYMTNDLSTEDLKFGTMSVCALDCADRITCKPEWLAGNWWDGAHDFWDDFMDDGELISSCEDSMVDSKLQANIGKIRIGSVCNKQSIEPGQASKFIFLIAWHFPNRMSAWNGHLFSCEAEKNAKRSRNFYAVRFSDVWSVIKYFIENQKELESQSLLFEETLYSSDLPSAMLEAVAANITVLRSTTCFRLDNGKFFGWEGTFDHRGCCEGNCTHVWNYQQTLAFLFPELERDMRRTEFLFETDSDGSMAFRASRALGNEKFDLYPPAADGQLGCIIRLYRDWKLSGDKELIRDTWRAVKQIINYALTRWDTDGDFVLDAMQHNTYDVEFYGINPLTNVIFLAALHAAAQIAHVMNESELANRWIDAARNGAVNLDKKLFNGNYYQQEISDINRYKYQVGRGCLSDQLLGQVLAHIAGLGYILPKEHVKKAMLAIYKNNFRKRLGEHINVQRAYALAEEGGLLMCTWPEKDRPKFPFPYCDEVWTGVEYQVATGLIYEGYVEKAIKIVEAVRSRYDGLRRNPWNEVECGNHYARSMSSWGMLLAMSGYSYDISKNQISFNPVYRNFQCFFSTGKSWGVYRQFESPDGELKKELIVLYGDEKIELLTT